MALKKYKQHGTHFVNKNNHNQIMKKLKIKLTIDYITNIDFLKTNAHNITRKIFYCLNFAKITYSADFEETRKRIRLAHSERLLSLPNTYQQLPRKIKAILLYDLLITDINKLNQ